MGNVIIDCMMTFGDFLLSFFDTYHGSYKKLRMDMAGYSWPEDFPYDQHKKHLSEGTIRTTLWRLKRKGFLENNNRAWKLTKKGKEYITAKLFRRSTPTSKKKRLIIAFDVPEKMRKKRDWLRGELIVFGFKSLQKSVWFGPVPLPEYFIEEAKQRGVLQYIRFFEAKEADII